MNPIQLQTLIRKVLLEEVEKRSSTDREIYKRVPEVNHAEEYKDIVPHERDSRTKDEILNFLTKTVKEIDSSATVVWDDHDDIMVNARDMFRVRITPRWEYSYNIEAFIRNEDRIVITNQSCEQVAEFLKINLKNATTNTQKAYDKSKQNADMKNDKTPSPDKGLSQKDKPSTMPLTNEPPRTSKAKDKDYTEKQTKDEADLPEKPMKEVTGFKRQEEHKSRSAITLRHEKTKFPEKKPNTQLSVKIPEQDTSKWRKK
jgi:hypothetical protein